MNFIITRELVTDAGLPLLLTTVVNPFPSQSVAELALELESGRRYVEEGPPVEETIFTDDEVGLGNNS